MNEGLSHLSSSSFGNEEGIIYLPRIHDTTEDITNDVDSSSSDQSSSSEENSAIQISHHEDNDNAVDLRDLPAARDHSYLPGTRHPLYSLEVLRNSCPHDRNCTMNLQEPPHNDSDYLTTKLEPFAIELPILQLDGVVLFPNSSLPLRITNASFCQYLRREIDHARSSVASFGSNDVDGHKSGDPMQMQVRIGIVTRLQETRRTNHQRPIRRLAGADTQVEDRDGQQQGDVPVRRRMGRWNLAMIRRNVIPTRDNGDGEDNDDSSSDESGIQQRVPHRQRRRPPEERSINYGRSLPTDRLKGRIGTFATIISVNEANTSVEGDGDNNSHHLIITCRAT